VLSGRGPCDELITRPEESYRLCCVVVCDLETSRMGAPYIYDISHLRVNNTHRNFFVNTTEKAYTQGTLSNYRTKPNKIHVSILDDKIIWHLWDKFLYDSYRVSYVTALDRCSEIKISLKNHAVKMIMSGKARDAMSAAASNRNYFYVERDCNVH